MILVPEIWLATNDFKHDRASFLASITVREKSLVCIKGLPSIFNVYPNYCEYDKII